MEINKNVDIKCKALEIGDFIISCKRESEENYKYDYDISMKSQQREIEESRYMGDMSEMTINQNSQDKTAIQDIIKTFEHASDTNLNHKEIMESKNMYSCSNCTFKTKSKHSYMLHMNKHNILICVICSRQFQRKSSVENHTDNHNEAISFKCHLCGFADKIKENFKRYIQKDQQGTDSCNDKCPNCSYQLNNETHIKTDILCNSFKENRFECPMCNYKSDLKYNCHFKGHLKTYLIDGIEQFKCPKCGFRTDYVANMKLHLEYRHTDEERYNCLSFDFYTYERSRFNLHALVHDDTRPYACDVCGKSFKQSTSLKRHSLTHSKEKGFHGGE